MTLVLVRNEGPERVLPAVGGRSFVEDDLDEIDVLKAAYLDAARKSGVPSTPLGVEYPEWSYRNGAALVKKFAALGKGGRP